MPNRYAVYDQGKTVIEVWTGRVPHQELIFHERSQLQDSSIHTGAVVLVDARRASFETDVGHVHELADEYRRTGEKVRYSKAALLVSDETWDRAQLFARQMTSFGVVTIAFSSITTACTWLGLDHQVSQDRLRSLGI